MEKKGFILVGLTNSGKSSMLNEMSGQQIAVVGLGTGSSTTRSAQTHRFVCNQLNLDMAIVDFPGFLDTSLQLSDEIILKNVKAIVAECLSDDYTFYGFIICVSLEDEINHHLTNINRLAQILGGGILGNIVLAVTHCDELSVTQGEIARRFPQIDAECARLGIHAIKWSNAPGCQLPDQYTNLKSTIDGMTQVNCSITTEIDTLISIEARRLADACPPPSEADINSEAQRISNLQPNIEHTIVEEEEKTVQVPYTVQETRTRMVNDTEEYEDRESYAEPVTVKVQKPFVVTKESVVGCGGNTEAIGTAVGAVMGGPVGAGIGKLIGAAGKKTKTVTTQEIQYREVEETKNETRWRDVTRLRPIQRQENYTEPVVYYREETQLVPTPRTHMAPPSADLFTETARTKLTPTPQAFMSEARRIVSNRLRQQIQAR